MLMISERREEDAHTFRLAGPLAGDWAVSFKRCWHKATRVLKPSRIVVDLTDVTFVDEAGAELLASIVKAGARLVGFDILMKPIVEEIFNEYSIA